MVRHNGFGYISLTWFVVGGICPVKVATRAPANRENKRAETETEVKSTFLSKAIPTLHVAVYTVKAFLSRFLDKTNLQKQDF